MQSPIVDPQLITLSQLKVFQFIPTSREENFKGLETLHQFKRNCFKDIHLITSLIIVLGEVERRGFPFKDIKPTTIYTDGKICYIKEKDFTSLQYSNIVGNDSFKTFNSFVQQQFSYHKFQGVQSFDKALPKIYNVDELTTDQEVDILRTVYEITHDQIDEIKLGYFNKNQLNSQFKLETKYINEQKNSESIYKDINKLEKLNDLQSVCQMISYIRIGTTMNIFTEYFQQNLEQFLKLQVELKTSFVEKLFEGLKAIHLKLISHENLCPQQIYLIDNQNSFQFKFQILPNNQENSHNMPPNFKGSNQDDMWQMGLIFLRHLLQSQSKLEQQDHKKYNEDLIKKLDEIKNSENNNLFIPLTFSLLQYNKDVRCNHDKLCQEMRSIERKQQFIPSPDISTQNIQPQLYEQIDYQQKDTNDKQQGQQPQPPEKDIKIASSNQNIQNQSLIKPKQNIQINQIIQDNNNQNQIGTKTIIKLANQNNQAIPQIQINQPQQQQLAPPINDQKQSNLLLKNTNQMQFGQQQIIKNTVNINQQPQNIIQKFQLNPSQQQNSQISIQQNLSKNLYSTENPQQLKQFDSTNPNNQSNLNNQRQGSNP